MLSLAPLALLPFVARSAVAQVTATFPNGVTNPAAPSFAPVGSTVNQTSDSRLLTLNGVDDFCIYGPPEPGPDSLIGNVEPIVVAYCTKPRNGARLIPDGAITAAHFIRTPLYVQIHGFWDGTKMNIPTGDSGGELDPHGAENVGNPIGGNVTSNVPTGSDVFYEEWMSFVSYDQFCLRICTAQNGNVTTALQCEHELDVMGCQFVMAIEDFYSSDNSFTSCEGEPAAPPGLYPQSDGSTSTFRQRYVGSYTDQGTLAYWTVGQTITPSAPAFYPATSNCVTYSTISNGVNTANFQVTAAPAVLSGGQTNAVSASSASASSSSSASGPRSSGSASSSSQSRAPVVSASTSGISGSVASASRSGGNAAASVSSAAAQSTGAAMLGASVMGGSHSGVLALAGGLVAMLVGAVIVL